MVFLLLSNQQSAFRILFVQRLSHSLCHLTLDNRLHYKRPNAYGFGLVFINQFTESGAKNDR
jgi:hypothetical protein